MDISSKSSKPVLVCALVLLAAFFMPWIQLFGAGLSGYNLGQLGSYGNYVWIVPALAGGTILVSFLGINNRGIGIVTGVVPLAGIAYLLVRLAGQGSGFSRESSISADQLWQGAQHVLSIGAWLTVIFSIAIIAAGSRKSVGALQPEPENAQT